MLEPKYSIIKFCSELLEDDIESLYNYIQNGIIIHLFLSGKFKEEMYEDFKLAIKYNLLCLYEEVDNLLEDNRIIAIDGEVLEKDIYLKIANNKLYSFNSNQYDIVTAPFDSNIIVISGAGTGKTTTMINRMIFLRKTIDNFSFEDVAMITFTNKASMEMREKLLNLLDKYYKVTKKSDYLYMMDEVSKCSISTIHGFSKKLINKYGKNIGINKEVIIKSFKYRREMAITEALNKIYSEEKYLYEIVKYYPIYELESRILSLWDKLDNYSIDTNSKTYEVDFGNDDKGFSKLLFKVISYAQEIIDNEKDNSFEISDLMKKLSDKNLYNDTNKMYKLIMVDEFQDSDNIQIEFIANFCKATNCNLLVVGDEKQSIYRFRGAEYTSFEKLKEYLSNSNKEILEFTMVRNYRTDASLLWDINNIFIDVDKKVKCFSYKERDYLYSQINKDKINKINYINLADFEDKAKFYSNLLDNKKENETIAVLLRTNNDIKEFKDFCDRHQIPCRIDETGGFYRHEAVRDFYIMIKALIENNIATNYSFIQTPYINKYVNKNIILGGSNEDKDSHIRGLLDNCNWFNYKNKISQVNSIDLIDYILINLKPISNYYSKTLLEAKKTQKRYKEIAYIKTLEYKLNLEHLIYLIKNNFSKNMTSIYQIENYLKIKIATDNTIDPRKTSKKYENNFIQCLTVHKAKGLEYDYVIMDKLSKQFITSYKKTDVILRSNDNNIINVGYKVLLGDNNEEYKNDIYSYYYKDEKNEIIGEESRLLYVALTRCKRNLYLNMEGNIAATEKINTWKSLVGGIIEYV